MSLTAFGTAYSQNFDSLVSSGTSSALPLGWFFDETAANANTSYTANTGASNAGDVYSYGLAPVAPATTTERAFGMLRSGNLVPIIGASFTNNTGGTITDLNIAYTGEQWRLGTSGRTVAPTIDRMDFQISTDATSLTTGTYTDVNSLDFSSPISVGTVGALNGNLAANRTNLSATISNLSIPNGSKFFIRWTDLDASSADDGLAVDDFSITPQGFIPPTPTNPSASGTASPSNVLQGSTTLLTVNVTPGTIPTSVSYTVTGDLSSIGGSSAQPFADSGNNSFTFNATVAGNTPPGAKSLPISVVDDQGRPASASIALNVLSPTVSHIVISQVYGGGGNSGATYKNDFIELYNPTSVPVVLNGWSVQYASAGGTTWQITDLSGTLAPGQYYLIQEAQGAGGSTNLPTPNATGNIPMSATSGKVALVDNSDSLGSGCLDDPDIIDFIGYGASASCFEGARTANLSNTTAALRNGNGNVDTDNNNADFTIGAPTPRNSTGGGGGGETAPFVSSTTPAKFATNVLVDANISVNFSEPVNVTGSWFDITCPSGTHAATVSGGPTNFTLNPSVNFANSEQCTVTIKASQVTDVDLNDPPNNMLTDYSWTFTTISSSGVIRDPAEHLVMGNPSNAEPIADTDHENNYLMMKPEYALSYNRSRAIPNWTSWHLDNSWLGSQPRTNAFRADTSLPDGWYQVNENSYSGSGFDRGHMTPSADRTFTYQENADTFLMTNMVPQAPDNNQVTWEGLESYARTLVNGGNELYIISGGYGQGGTGRNGFATTVDSGRVVVPAYTWKVILVLPNGSGDDVPRVTTQTRTIAVIMPNAQGIDSDWHKFIVSVDEVEALTGYDFFSNVPVDIQAVIEANADGNTRPTANGQSVTLAEDGSKDITLTGLDAENNALTYAVVSGPTHGSLSGSGANLTYTPDPDYNGTDSFTFTVKDKYLTSEPATVLINVTEVNDPVTANNDSKNTPEDTQLVFAASDLTGNDSAGPNESSQTLTVTGVISTPNTHGSVVLNAGQITYTPAANYNGPASFDYQVCDDGTTNGVAASQCATATVNITVDPVDDAPTLAAIGNKTVYLGDTLSFTAVGSDIDQPAQQPLLYSLTGTVPQGAMINNTTGEFSWTPTAQQVGAIYTFNVRVTDNGNLFAEEQISVGVAYTWSNLLAPLDASGNSSFNVGRTVPVKFALTGASSGISTATASLWIAKVTNGVAGPESPAVSTSSATTGNLFRYDVTSGQYIFNLNTKGLTPGVYQLRVDTGDGVFRAVNITLN